MVAEHGGGICDASRCPNKQNHLNFAQELEADNGKTGNNNTNNNNSGCCQVSDPGTLLITYVQHTSREGLEPIISQALCCCLLLTTRICLTDCLNSHSDH